ncbi:MAG TPA: hypothetical protein VF223_19645 [Trebonia sp.]
MSAIVQADFDYPYSHLAGQRADVAGRRRASPPGRAARILRAGRSEIPMPPV